MNRLVLVLALVLAPLFSFAKSYKLEGKVGGKYPIMMELQEYQKGLFSGKYAYNLTLKRNGDVDCSWLKIKPNPDSPYSEWQITDCKGKIVERWYDIDFTGGKSLTARMTNSQGKTYTIEATVSGLPKTAGRLNSYFREHLGDYASEFNMFKNEQVSSRFQKMMGIMPFDSFLDIYEVQVPIEYKDGMFWASGFMAHQCCDPAALWAYDSHDNVFYAWVRKNGKDYWWSESGTVPYKFHELVNNNF